jgi:CSLREA domain-containing protein
MAHSGRGSSLKWAMAGLMVLALVWGAPAPQAEAAAFVVTRFDDPDPFNCLSGIDCSLREAIIAANNNGGTDTVQVPAGVYTLTIAGSDDQGLLGDLDVRGQTTIESTGGVAIISADASFDDRIFDVITTSTTVTFSNLVMRGGEATGLGGGGLRVGSGVDVRLMKVTVEDNTATGVGGGIRSDGILLLAGSQVWRNNSDQGGGGVFADFGSTLVISDSKLMTNTVTGGTSANGGAIELDAFVHLTLLGGQVFSNTASGNGGGIYTTINTRVSISGTAIVSNTAFGGGGLRIAGEVTITQALLQDNISRVQPGGAIHATGGLTLTQSAVVSNTAVSATGGGAFFHPSATVVITNVTVSGNTANLHGGGFSMSVGATVRLEHVSVISNTTNQGNGGGLAPSLNTRLHNTLVAGNLDLDDPAMPDCSSTLVSPEYSLLGSLAGCTLSGTPVGVISNTTAMAGPLTGSGFELTHELAYGSPALSAADPAACAATDQRGTLRPLGAGCDLGAWEGDPVATILELFLPLVLR